MMLLPMFVVVTFEYADIACDDIVVTIVVVDVAAVAGVVFPSLD